MAPILIKHCHLSINKMKESKLKTCWATIIYKLVHNENKSYINSQNNNRTGHGTCLSSGIIIYRHMFYRGLLIYWISIFIEIEFA